MTVAGYLDRYREARKDPLAALNEQLDVPAEDLDRVARERLYGHAVPDLPKPPFHRILDHIDRMVQIAGIDHVGLGSSIHSRIHGRP